LKSKSIIILVALLTSIVGACRSKTASVEQVTQSIEQEVPKEATVAQVIAFLDRHGIAHADQDDEPKMSSDFRNNPKLDGKRERIKSRMGGLIHNSESGLLVTWSISLNFYFDSNGKLVEYTVKKLGTGL
jgi:alpha-D-ribose 1-methylphosphonate 5-triphosphate synthase subunit PhnI